MDLPECYTHSFIVKIWLEVTTEEAERATWRGHITHVPSGERRYVQDLDDITAFVAPYLEAMGAKLGIQWQVRDWLRRLKACFGRALLERRNMFRGMLRFLRKEDGPRSEKIN